MEIEMIMAKKKDKELDCLIKDTGNELAKLLSKRYKGRKNGRSLMSKHISSIIIKISLGSGGFPDVAESFANILKCVMASAIKKCWTQEQRLVYSDYLEQFKRYLIETVRRIKISELK